MFLPNAGKYFTVEIARDKIHLLPRSVAIGLLGISCLLIRDEAITVSGRVCAVLLYFIMSDFPMETTSLVGVKLASLYEISSSNKMQA